MKATYLQTCVFAQGRPSPLQPVLLHTDSYRQIAGNEQNVNPKDLYVRLGTHLLYIHPIPLF